MKRMIFICGLHRSGTTLLEHYLYSSFETCALRASVPENEGQFLQDVYQPAYKYGGPGKFAFSKKMEDDLLTLNEFSEYRKKIMRSWSNYVVGEGDFLIEKSPPNITKMWWLRKVFPDAIFIVWTRDPRAVSGATQKWSNTSLHELMQHWNTAYSIAKNDISSDTIVIQYEDFCMSPENCFEKSGIEKFIKRRAKPIALEKRFHNISNTNARYIELFEDIIIGKGIWEDFGYNLNI